MNEGFKMLAQLGFKPLVMRLLGRINVSSTLFTSVYGGLQIKAIKDKKRKGTHFFINILHT